MRERGREKDGENEGVRAEGERESRRGRERRMGR